MKKLLILLIGFAFTQSIQTKQFEITIEDWTLLSDSNDISRRELDFTEYLNLDGLYVVKTLKFELLDESSAIYEESISISSCDSLFDDAAILQYMSYNPSSGYYSYNGIAEQKISSDCPILHIGSNNELPSTFTFWVTGMFEDEGIGLQGDMNNDDVLDVVDVVALVNTILE